MRSPLLIVLTSAMSQRKREREREREERERERERERARERVAQRTSLVLCPLDHFSLSWPLFAQSQHQDKLATTSFRRSTTVETIGTIAARPYSLPEKRTKERKNSNPAFRFCTAADILRWLQTIANNGTRWHMGKKRWLVACLPACRVGLTVS